MARNTKSKAFSLTTKACDALEGKEGRSQSAFVSILIMSHSEMVNQTETIFSPNEWSILRPKLKAVRSQLSVEFIQNCEVLIPNLGKKLLTKIKRLSFPERVAVLCRAFEGEDIDDE